MAKYSRRAFLRLLSGITGAILLSPSSFAAGGKRLVMHYGINLEPLSFFKDGSMHGILVDLMDTVLGKGMGWEVEHFGFPWARAQQLVREGLGDGICTNPTEARKEYVLFSDNPLLTISFDLFYSLANPRWVEIERVSRLEDLRTMRIIDYKGNNLARSIYPETYDVLWANSPEQIIQVLANNRRDVYVGNPLYAMRIIREMKVEHKIGRLPVNIMPSSNYHFGVRNTFPSAGNLIRGFDHTVMRMEREGVLESVRNRYF